MGTKETLQMNREVSRAAVDEKVAIVRSMDSIDAVSVLRRASRRVVLLSRYIN